MKLPHDRLAELTAAIFHTAGCSSAEADRIAAHLVEANLVGHDSHGVIRVPSYIQWLRAGKVLADRTLQIVFENEALAVVDGQFGFGQTIGEQAVRLGIEKSARHGVAVIALRNAGHASAAAARSSLLNATSAGLSRSAGSCASSSPRMTA